MPSGKHRRVAQQFCAAHAFQARRANRFERQPGLRHQLCFQSRVRFRQSRLAVLLGYRLRLLISAPEPFLRYSHRRENVSAGAAARDQQISLHPGSSHPRHLHPRSRLVRVLADVQSTPVANSMPSRLEPP